MKIRIAGAISLLVVLSLVAWTGAYAQDDDGGGAGEAIIDDSTNDSGNSNVEAQYQGQNCSVVVDQYNNAIAGDATSSEEAVAETAAIVNAPVNVIQVCLQAGGDIILDSGNDDGNDDDNNDDDNDDNTTSRETDVLAETIPNKVLANTGGVSPLLPVSFALVGAGLLGFGILRRR